MRRCLAAIVDYGLGNLYSVQQACAHVGMQSEITSMPSALMSADAVILPGVGAFGDAMNALRQRDLIGVIKDLAAAGKPLFGVCLGMQLMMSESLEFGHHEGLGLVPGKVVRLPDPSENERALKIPQVGWNRISPSPNNYSPTAWNETLLQGLPTGAYQYFVHSFIAQPADPSVILAETQYGNVTFSSAVRYGSVTAVQFHPERSGPAGLSIYRNLASIILNKNGH